jgi:hypothetical protein
MFAKPDPKHRSQGIAATPSGFAQLSAQRSCFCAG